MSSQLELGIGVHIFGVRHLSPGGSKHLLDDLNRIKPKIILIEGPSDASSEIRHITQRQTKPPIAILAFTEELPVRTALWPLASYSPEYQAMKWAADHKAQSVFIDLPSSVMIALQDMRKREQQQRAESSPTPDPEQFTPQAEVLHETVHESLYDRIAQLSGEDDYDMYWERNYEHNLNEHAYRQAILQFSEQMRELTEAEEQHSSASEHAYNAIRESYMRRQIKQTIESGYQPEDILVVCGAYHAAALSHVSDVMTDQELQSLPSSSTKLTLMPYSYYKLSSMSGYGAGNHAPHYYEMMWQQMNREALDELPHLYLSSVARLLRKAGTHRSTAEVIEAVRMAQSLSALHGGSIPVLRDLQDAAQTLLGHGDLSVIAESLAQINVGTTIGQLAEGVSQTPIQDDLNRLLQQLKLTKYKTTIAQDLMLDLRENRRVQSKESAFLDLHRSFLFHRLRLLNIHFVQQQQTQQDQATWAERWIIQWSPEVEIQVVESTLLGETVEIAAAYVLQQKLDHCLTIAEASDLILIACESGMVTQLENGRQTLQRLAVDNQDVIQITLAARSLSKIIQYGDLRRIDTMPLIPLLEQLFTRASLFLVTSCQCNDEVAHEMMKSISELHTIGLDHIEQLDYQLWIEQLTEVMERDDLNAKLSGFACSLLIERNQVSATQLAAEVSRRLSPGVPADLGAGWFEGLSSRNRYMLLSRTSLWEQLHQYIESLEDDDFVRALVFLRRAFSTFSPSEKNMIAELLGELWGVNTEQAAEILTEELKEEEAKMIDDLNDFDFEDFLMMNPTDNEHQRLSRWRLILGADAEQQLERQTSSAIEGITLTEEEKIMDQALAAIYDDTSGQGGNSGGGNTGGKGAGKGPSSPTLTRWLGDVRTFFPEDVVSIIQNDAMERKGWKQLLFEPEVLSQVKPDITLVGTLMALKGKIPEKTKETARILIQSVVDDLVKRLEQDIRRAVTGALNRRQHSPLPSLSGIDWKRTIQRNLKHYNQERRQIIPEKFYYFDRARRSHEWKVIIDIDQSGSMADSIIWASVTASIFASMPALDTRVVAFDTSVVDLTEQCNNDPVDMLFGIQLGGGTNIDKSVAYCEQFIEEPKKTLFILISDLYEGGSQARLIRRMRELKEAGVKTLCLLALSDEGKPFYDKQLAQKFTRDGTPSFACTPALLPALVEGALKGQDLTDLVKRLGIAID